MLYSVTGTIHRLLPPLVTVATSGGVGYIVSVPLPVWESLDDKKIATLITYTFVREDRLELFGFLKETERTFFTELLNLDGIGPKTALELCSISRSLLENAVSENDGSMLTKVKGIGKKTAEKLLVDLKSMHEKHPEWFASGGKSSASGVLDEDAVTALVALGYDRSTVIDAVKKLPKSITRTEDRVTAVLRSI